MCSCFWKDFENPKFHILSFFFSLLRGQQEWGLLRSHHGICHYDTCSLCVNSITAVCPSLSLSSSSHTHSQELRVTLKICSCGVHHKVCGFHHHLNQAEEKKTSTVRVNTPTSSRTYVLHAGLRSRHLSDFKKSLQKTKELPHIWFQQTTRLTSSTTLFNGKYLHWVVKLHLCRCYRLVCGNSSTKYNAMSLWRQKIREDLIIQGFHGITWKVWMFTQIAGNLSMWSWQNKCGYVFCY